MNRISLGVFAGLLALGQACATSHLWECTDPEQKIWVPADRTSEKTLKKRGLNYEVFAGETAPGYFVEKDKWQKALDIQLRILGTPPALALDIAAGAALVVLAHPELLVWAIDAGTSSHHSHGASPSKPSAPKAPPPAPSRPPAPRR